METPPSPPNSAAENPPPAPAAGRFVGRAAALHIFVLSSLVFAQPLFDLLARNAEFFVVRRTSGGEVLALVAVLLVLVPLPLVALVAVARRLAPRLGAPRLGEWVQVAVVAALSALLALLTLTRASLLDGAAWLTAGLVAGAACAWAYRRLAALRLVLTYLAVALVAVPALFLLDPRMRKIVFGSQGAGGAVELHTTGARTPIVFLLFDEFSLTALLDERRRIDPVSYPNLAALAGEATWFANATTVSDATELAVPAIVTGRAPHKNRLPILQEYPQNLFTLFGDYQLWAAEPITALCPVASNTAAGGRPQVSGLRSLFSDLWVVYQHLLLPPRFSAHLPVISDRWQDFGARRAAPPPGAAPPPEDAAGDKAIGFSQSVLVALAGDRQQKLRRFLEALDPEVDRALYFLHILLPHTPWEYLPSGKAYGTQTDRIPGLDKATWQDEEAFVVQAYQRYLLQVQYLDRWLGELVERLRQLDLYDRSLIVLTADHGVSFRPGDQRRAMTDTNYSDVIPVPLLIKAPGERRGRVVEHPVSTLDILPTILDLLDLEAPWPLAGRSAFAAAPPAAIHPVVGKFRDLELDDSIHRDKYATLDWKLATFGAGGELLRAGTHPELYGRRLDEVGWRHQDTVRLHLEGESLFHRDAGDSAWSPAFISGALETAAADGGCCDLAVAVNGTLYATVRAFGSPPDDLRFTALVPDAAFVPGDNRVEVLRIRRGGPEPELERLGSSGGAPYDLVADAGGRPAALERDGESLPVEARALRGYFSIEEFAHKLTVSGWAVDVEASASPEEVLVFHRGEMVYSGLTTTVREDVNELLGLVRPVRSAFQFHLPAARVPDLQRSGLRLFARSRSAASELGVFYSLETDEGGGSESIQVTNGRRIPIVDGAVPGFLEDVTADGERLIVRGWAADVEHREPVERILVFAAGKTVHNSSTLMERGDVAASYELPEILLSGFEYSVGPVSGGAVDGDQLRVFAVSRHGEASLLPPVPRP